MNLTNSPKNYDRFVLSLFHLLKQNSSSSSSYPLPTESTSDLSPPPVPPSLDFIKSRLNPNLVSPYILVLPQEIYDQASFFIHHLHQHLGVNHPGGFSPSLDFHWHPLKKQLYLIEANTNAAFMGLSIPLYESHDLESPLKMEDLQQQIFCILGGHSSDSPCSGNIPTSNTSTGNTPTLKPRQLQGELAIVDSEPKNQALYLEFLFYQTILSSVFSSVSIKDPRELSLQETYIYNRLTDFDFAEKENHNLYSFWSQHPHKVTPHPEDYRIFADKLNFQDWITNPYLQPFLATTIPLTIENQESLWNRRKTLFFKPNRSYGSKKTYRGESISKKNFEALTLSSSGLAQEYIPAPEILSPHHGLLKFDLRFYFFKGTITQTVARLYQGQVTNAKTLGGGFAPILWQK
jgi:hypothetical protein